MPTLFARTLPTSLTIVRTSLRTSPVARAIATALPTTTPTPTHRFSSTMVAPFTFQAHIPRTIFGSGTLAKVPEEVNRLGAKRVMIVTENTDRQIDLANKISASLGDLVAGV